MYLTKLQKMTAISVFALGLTTAYSSSSWAVPATYELDSDNPITIPVSVTVNEAVQVDTSPMTLGTIGVHQDKSSGGVGVGSLTLDPTTGLVSANNTGAARIVADSDPAAAVLPTPAIVTITSAFPTAVINVHYQNTVDLVCDSANNAANACQTTTNQTAYDASAGTYGTTTYAAPKFLITGIADDLSALTAVRDAVADGTAPAPGSTAGALSCPTGAGSCTSTDGSATTGDSGDLTFSIGATIATAPGQFYYASGIYEGSFDVTMSY